MTLREATALSLYLVAGCAPAAVVSAADAGGPLDLEPSPVRSRLYPGDWKPGFHDGEGRFLHDFSYAGYHRSEAPLPDAPPGRRFDAVRDFGADPSGATDATGAIQAALTAAGDAGGGVVRLPAGSYRCDGVLEVTKRGVVLRGDGADKTRLRFTRIRGMTDRSHLTFRGSLAEGPMLPLVADGENQSFVVSVADAGSLAAGDDVSVGWTITDAFVAEHGMTGVWTVFNGQWKPFFRRTVVAVDLRSTPNRITLDVPLRYPARLRDLAAVRRETGYLDECGVESLAVSNAVDFAAAWTEHRSHAIQLLQTRDGWLRGVDSFASPDPAAMGAHLQSGGFLVKDSKRVTIADSHLERAENRGEGGDGYLFEVSTSNEVLVRDAIGFAGRHNFIQNWDFGTTGCVFLRCDTGAGLGFAGINDRIGKGTWSEFHHSLAMACLVDGATVRDGWEGGNRLLWSSGAGHTLTQSVFWNTSGDGQLLSYQFGWGYVIGTSGVRVHTDSSTSFEGVGTLPDDWVELQDQGARLSPSSLFEDQLRRRLGQ